MTLPRNDIRPPCSALASIGSISRDGGQKVPPAPFSGLGADRAIPTRTGAAADKPPNALHNPVTLHVVCQLTLLRSLYGGRERYLNAHVSQGGWPVLVLNADFRPLSYYPLSLWSWQDAIKAVFLDPVNRLERYHPPVPPP